MRPRTPAGPLAHEPEDRRAHRPAKDDARHWLNQLADSKFDEEESLAAPASATSPSRPSSRSHATCPSTLGQ
jgi:hypothetical protein